MIVYPCTEVQCQAVIKITCRIRGRSTRQPRPFEDRLTREPFEKSRRSSRIHPYSSSRLSLSAFTITEIELKLIAAAATIGLSRRPNHG